MSHRVPLGDDLSPIVFYYYFDLSNSAFFNRVLERRFRETGHTRRIEFREWNCYNGEPGRDGDLFSFDGIVLSALVDKGYLRPLPEIVPTDALFSWTLDKSKVRRRAYGIPIMVCSNVLICRKEDDGPIRNVFDLRGSTAVPMRSMFMYYYLQAFCNYQDLSGKSLAPMRRLLELMGGREALKSSSLVDYDGIGRFSRGECRYLLGFTEHLRALEQGDYAVRLANFSENEEDQMPLFMVDYLAMGGGVSPEKLLDCLDLMEIAADESFVCEVCTEGGRLQYMLPANRNVYPRLAALDPLYEQFFRMLDSEENGVFRYGARFYEEFDQKSSRLLEMLDAPAL